MRDGTKANKRGTRFAQQIAQACTSRGFSCTFEVPITRSMYRHTQRADLKLLGIPQYDDGILIEAKWQQSSGSADEKYPYLVGNIKGDYGGAPGYPLPTIIIYGGPGARESANQWLKRQVGGKLIRVFTFEEFVCWLNSLDDIRVPTIHQGMLRLY